MLSGPLIGETLITEQFIFYANYQNIHTDYIMAKKDIQRFQIKLDSDSILISQAPEKNKSRVILANLKEEQIEQILDSIEDANLEQEFFNRLDSRLKAKA